MLQEIPKWKAKGVGVINASPLCMGLLTPQGPPEWHPAAPELREAAAKAAEIAAELGASLPRIAIKDAVKNEEISSTLVGLCTPEQVHENCDAVLEALGVIESGAGAEQAEQTALAKIEKIFEPVMDMTWPSGRPENDKREAKLSWFVVAIKASFFCFPFFDSNILLLASKVPHWNAFMTHIGRRLQQTRHIHAQLIRRLLWERKSLKPK
jgi:hypothetical protein